MNENELATSRTDREAVRNPWLGVELRHLAALAAVAREGSFRSAAESLGYVQSAVSQQLAQLERVVNWRLVDRERGASAVALTPAGEMLLEHAERVLSGLGAAQADLEALTEGRLGRLRVGVSESLAAGILSRVLPRLRARTPRVTVEAVEAPAGTVAARVAEGSLDAAFAELPLAGGPFVATQVCTNPYLLLAPSAELAAGPDEAPGLAELRTLPLIGHPLMGEVEPVIRASGVTPRYELWCESLAALPTLVASGTGCAIVPGLLGFGSDDRLAAFPLDEVIPPRKVCIFRHAGRRASPSTELLVELAAWVCGPLGDDRYPGSTRAARPGLNGASHRAVAPLRSAS